MRHRGWFGFALGGLALVVLVGSSSAGRAVAKVSGKVVPLALYANNARKLDGHTAALSPKAGQIPVVGVSGKLPGSILPVGSVGPAGPAGPAGQPGQNLTSQTPLQSGQSESGFYGTAGGTSTNGRLLVGITFAQPLSAPIPNANVDWMQPTVDGPHCPGNGKADPGYLCLYDWENHNVGQPFAAYSSEAPFSQYSMTSWGAILSWTINGSGSYVDGEYTVTAP